MKAAFGEVVDVRAVPSRAVTRIVLELPVEAFPALAAMLFGKRALVTLAPDDLAVPFGIVESEPLADSVSCQQNEPAIDSGGPVHTHGHPAPEQAPGEAVDAKAPPAPERRRDGKRRGIDPMRPFASYAGIFCNDREFWQWVEESDGVQIFSVEGAATWLRGYLGIKSRTELDENDIAKQRFRTTVMARFAEWKKGRAA